MEVIYPSMKGGRKVFPAWENPPDAVADIDLSSVQDKLPDNVDMVVVPKDFAELVKGAKPQLSIVHAAQAGVGAGGSDDLPPERLTIVMTVLHVQSVIMRLLRLDKSAGERSLVRMRMKPEDMGIMRGKVVGSSTYNEVLQGCKPSTPRELNAALRRFQKDVQREDAESGIFVLSSSMVTLEAELGLPNGVAADSDKATAAMAARGWKSANTMEMLEVSSIVKVGDSMELAVDLMDFFGATDLTADRLGAQGMYQKIIAPIFAAMPDPGAAEAELSAV